MELLMLSLLANCTVNYFLLGNTQFQHQKVVFLHSSSHISTDIQSVYNLSGYEFLNEFVFRPLNPLKYSHFCLVYLTEYDNKLKQGNILSLIANHSNSTGYKWPTNIPEFVVLFTHIKSKKWINLPADWSFKLVLADIERNEVFIPCLTCEFEAKRVKLISIQTTSKSALIKEWEKWNYNLQTVGLLNSSGLKNCDKFREVKKNIPYVPTLYLKCSVKIILEKQNCSGTKCIETYGSYLNAEASIWAIRRGKHWITTGTSSYGYKFVILIHKSRLNQKSDSYFLLKSFSIKAWLLVLSLLCLTCVTLKFHGMKHAGFWSATVILEQGDAYIGKLSWKTAHLIGGWLFACFFFRIAFTSNIYSVLTTEAKPTGLPETFRDMVEMKHANGVWELYGEQSLIQMLYDVRRARLISNFTQGEDIEIQLQERMIMAPPKLKIGELVKNFSKLEDVYCSRFVVHHNSTCSCAEEEYSAPFPKLLDKFAFIYRTRPGSSELLSNFFLRPLVAMLGKRKLFSNNEPEVLVDFRVWYFRKRTFFVERFQRLLERLVESGIDKKMKIYYRLVYTFQVMSIVKSEGKLNKTINFGSAIFSKRKTLQGIEKEKEKPHPVELNNFNGVLLLNGVLCIICTMVFLFETVIGS
ncbi:unnamed protein product [Orchesella dallaii]|uniref:Uncharacterized protein n=1 Tax=Orchesella dallaii TaxID=48710 RepID=A0ABP1RIK5_9HEXA